MSEVTGHLPLQCSCLLIIVGLTYDGLCHWMTHAPGNWPAPARAQRTDYIYSTVWKGSHKFNCQVRFDMWAAHLLGQNMHPTYLPLVGLAFIRANLLRGWTKCELIPWQIIFYKHFPDTGNNLGIQILLMLNYFLINIWKFDPVRMIFIIGKRNHKLRHLSPNKSMPSPTIQFTPTKVEFLCSNLYRVILTLVSLGWKWNLGLLWVRMGADWF